MITPESFKDMQTYVNDDKYALDSWRDYMGASGKKLTSSFADNRLICGDHLRFIDQEGNCPECKGRPSFVKPYH